jgi:DNA-directed RNA polymerase sigma subunit (sigma70/sigma32)
MESEHLRTTLSKYLRPKEMEALSWRYGLVQEEEDKESPQAKANRYLAEAEKELFGSNEQTKIEKRGRFGEAMTFNEVGKKMQVSAEYTRKLCHAALKKLRQAAEEGHLEPALLC